MEEENRVTLHGMSASLYTKRVELALKAKGIAYEYVEEDLMNKSQLLLQYNPVHKKVPVLVHNGRPITESLLILEYLDETWKDGPRFLPDDPYERAKVRFWARFIQQQLFEPMYLVLTSEGEAQERAIKEVLEKLKVLEEGIRDCFCYPGGSPYINRENLGFLDILMYSLLGMHKAYEEVIGIDFADPDKYPLISSWVICLTELPLVKELTPLHEKLVASLQIFRKKALESSKI